MTVDQTLIERYDDLIRGRWETFDQSVSRIVPNHGSIYLDRAPDIDELVQPPLRPERTRGPPE